MISVCIPSYNGAPYIRDAIESVLVQNCPDVEIVICDDQSDDNSWEIICSYADCRIKAFKNETNLGMVGNFREVLRKASGEYVILLNCDDTLYNDSLNKMATTLDDNPECSFVFGNIKYIGERSGQTNFNFGKILKPGEWVNASLQEGGNKSFQCGTLFRKPAEAPDLIIVDLVFFDWYLWLRLGQSKVAFLNEIVGCYRYHKSNQTNIKVPGYLNNYLGLRQVLTLSFHNGIINNKQLIKGINNLTVKYARNYFVEQGKGKVKIANAIKSGMRFCINYGFRRNCIIVRFLLISIKVFLYRNLSRI